METEKMVIVGIIGIFVLIVAISGCTTTTSSTKTFSDGVITFSYPNDFEETTYSGTITGSNKWVDVVKLLNGTVTIYAQKNPQMDSPAAAKNATEKSIIGLKNGKVLSSTTETNPKGVKMERLNFNLEDTKTGILLTHDAMWFESSNGVVYGIVIAGYETNKQDVKKVADIVFQSLEVR